MLSLPPEAFRKDNLTTHRGEMETNEMRASTLQNLPLEDDSV